ncbi:serine threonine protein kinase [Vairimorpha apis BRL 01]|uniref:Serine threonine protein kinase n=1 Tax=Vairimorpha apis BRL 01 TaxID=1037528 RepID=T0L138_9MICR|nr:serine threonine protein kinase [Vairimorpha apis BRL 01]
MMKNDKGINISAEISSLMNDSIGEYYNTGEVDNNEYKEDNYLCFYKIVRLLGTGSSSKVKKNHIFDKSDYRIFREVLITTLINHPYIVRLKDFMFNDQNYFLIFEYVAGKQLYDVIVNDGYLNESIARRYFRQILSAIDFIHRNSIVHRDLKIENILLDEFDNIKIIDFGLSNFYDNKSTLNTFCGSLYFAAPELLLGQRYSGPEIDVWSLGVILFVLLNGTVPFDDKDCKRTYFKMLHVDPKHRHTLEEILFSDWVNMEHDIPVNNYFIPQYPIDRINSSIIKNLSIILKFQFKNMEREIFRFFDVCLKDNKLLQLEYWTNRPIISLYFMMLEYFGDENCNDSLNDIRIEMEEDSLVSDIIFSDDKISYLKIYIILLHQSFKKIQGAHVQNFLNKRCLKMFQQKNQNFLTIQKLKIHT